MCNEGRPTFRDHLLHLRKLPRAFPQQRCPRLSSWATSTLVSAKTQKPGQESWASMASASATTMGASCWSSAQNSGLSLQTLFFSRGTALRPPGCIPDPNTSTSWTTSWCEKVTNEMCSTPGTWLARNATLTTGWFTASSTFTSSQSPGTIKPPERGSMLETCSQTKREETSRQTSKQSSTMQPASRTRPLKPSGIS
ncbi:mucin-13-like isoform X1 [Narcine bancroftii]|uniref:mucin-13-like isoform X1 n=1 Tax=Narcine bancroftii TaxID=1343680 RepID=UPI0038319F5D